MDALIKEYEILYEEMAELQAEGGAGGYTQKPLGGSLQSYGGYVRELGYMAYQFLKYTVRA